MRFRHPLALLDRLKVELPEIWNRARVVGKWVWLEFNVPPLAQIRTKLKELGFHWNGKRKCWQHPCAIERTPIKGDAPQLYPMPPAINVQMNEAIAPIGLIQVQEFKVISLRQCPLPEHMQKCESSQQAADYWRLNIALISVATSRSRRHSS